MKRNIENKMQDKLINENVLKHLEKILADLKTLQVKREDSSYNLQSPFEKAISPSAAKISDQ